MSETNPSIYMYCRKCNVQMKCLGIYQVKSDSVDIVYHCERCGCTVRMVIVYDC